ncbi:Transcription factor RFX3 [Plecturocebus cupreus]
MLRNKVTIAQMTIVLQFGDLNAVSPGNLDKDDGSEVESEMDEELDDSSEPQAKREKTELSQAFPVGCMQPVLETGVQPSLLNPIHSAGVCPHAHMSAHGAGVCYKVRRLEYRGVILAYCKLRLPGSSSCPAQPPE